MPEGNTQTELEQHIIRTMLYFDIFNYPLKSDEVHKYLQVNSVTRDDVESVLITLAEKKEIFRFGNLFSIRNESAHAERRQRGNEMALKLLPFAKRRGVFISKFPFVKAVMASGSFSKDYMDEKSDLDFFIVTESGKLWIARTLLVLYKRILLFNSHKYFCINYLVDETHLEIEEKNLFTATELASLIPLQNPNMYKKLIAANTWLKGVFPNFKSREVTHVAGSKRVFLKIFFEALLRPFAPKLENLFMAITLKRFHRIYQKHYSAKDFRIAFKTKKHASKNHPKNYQKKIMEVYHEKVNEFFRHETIARS